MMRSLSKVAAEIVLCPVCVHATCLCVITPVSGISGEVDISGVSIVDVSAKVSGTRHSAISNRNTDWLRVSGTDPARPISDRLFCSLWPVDQNGGSYLEVWMDVFEACLQGVCAGVYYVGGGGGCPIKTV